MLKIRRVAIIGGSGQMGRWFSKFFTDGGCEVAISGRKWPNVLRAGRELGVSASRTNAEAVRNADLIIISVTVGSFDSVVKEIAPHIRDGQAVIDVTSVKAFPVRSMHRWIRHGTVLGTHPMFGPSAVSKGQNLILTPTNSRERRLASEIRRYFSRRGFNVMTMTPQKHDEMIGIVLSLTHFVGFVVGDTWRTLGIHKLMKTSSTSFRFLKSFVDSIVESSPELYSYLQVNVPSAHKAESIFADKSREWMELAKNGREDELIERMSDLRDYIRKLK